MPKPELSPRARKRLANLIVDECTAIFHVADMVTKRKVTRQRIAQCVAEVIDHCFEKPTKRGRVLPK